MRIAVAELEVGHQWRSAFHEWINSHSDELTFSEPVTGTIEMDRTPRTLRLRGHLDTAAPMVCGRCATTYRQPLGVSLDEEFSLVPPGETSSHKELGPEDFVLPLGPDLVIDVSEVVRQHLLLAAPMVPLCTPTCRGLCPQCGANWNQESCQHEEATAPQLASLKEKLREKGIQA